MKYSRHRADRAPGLLPPVCGIPTDRGFCVLPEAHRAPHLPLPDCYPPKVAA